MQKGGKKGGKRNDKRSRRQDGCLLFDNGCGHAKQNWHPSVGAAVCLQMDSLSLSHLLGSARFSVGKTMVLRRSENTPV